MDDDRDDNNIIDLISRAKETEYTESSDTSEHEAWETHVDLSLQDLSTYIQNHRDRIYDLESLNRVLISELEDQSRDIRDLQKTVDRLTQIIIELKGDR